jgi:hypothetical protein
VTDGTRAAAEEALASLPWRAPEGERPELPLPPGKMPRRSHGARRKRWRYAAAFAEEVIACAARIHIGPLGQTFWAVVDREDGEIYERTRMLLPGARGEVWTEHLGGEEVVEELGDQGILDYAPDEGSLVRIDAAGRGPDAKAFMRFGGGTWAESVCPTSEGSYVWTRKRADVPVECDIRAEGRRWRVEARGMEDESAGYHPGHTVWSWSSGVGRTSDGRSLGWNLVEGINDPPERSERAIWVDGEPFEPGPVSFEGLDAIEFADGSRLEFGAEAERRREENKLIVKYAYRQPFGHFSGTMPGGIELERGTGVMEHHDAHW